jgi:sugar phosphate isomerase/epimerase
MASVKDASTMTNPNHMNRRAAMTGFAAASAGMLLNEMPSVQASLKESGEPKFKLGSVTYNILQGFDLPSLIEICQKTGISPVEFRTTHKHGIEPSLNSQARRDIKSRCADAGIDIWGCGSVCEFHATDESVVRKNIETCKTFLQLVSDIGGKGVKVRPNGLPKGVPVEKTLEQIGKALRVCGNAAEAVGVEVWVEVHGAGTQEPANMKTIMEQTNHKQVGITWNSNPTDVKKGSVAESFAMLKPWIRSCHINDLNNDAKGTYPYRELFRLLRESGYDRTTLIEVGQSIPDKEKCIAFLRDYKTLWQKLARA